MSLVTDCLAAGGTLLVALGSGLQAYTELIRYRDLARELGLVEVASAIVNLVRVVNRVYNNVTPSISIMPHPAVTWDLRRSLKALPVAIKRYIGAFKSIKLADLSEIQKNDVRAMGAKVVYWTLIMLGTLIIFASICVGIAHDLLT
jgi:hypothetical protein